MMQAADQIVIDELSSHTDTGRKELIHPYKVNKPAVITFKLFPGADPVWQKS